jgi:hypothetical protein
VVLSSAIVVSKNLLIAVTEKMEWFNANVSALEPSLYETPEILKAIRVNFPIT